MKPFLKFFEEAENGITVYHSSREEDLDHLEGGAPPYPGGIGSGVYVGTVQETAEFYGPHVYELRTKFGWDQVLLINEDNYEALDEGNSILVGESVSPFAFSVKNKRYAVVEGSGWPDDDNWVVKGIRIRKLFELLGIQEYNGLNPTDKSPKWINGILSTLSQSYQYGDFPDIDDFDDELYQWADEQNKGGRWPGHDQGRQSYLPGEIGDIGYKDFQQRTAQWNTNLESFVEGIKSQLTQYLTQADKAVEELGELISMEDIGDVVSQAGYPAVHVTGIRSGTGVNEEMLVFDEDDLKFIRQIN